MMEKIDRLNAKLDQLAEKDTGFTIFGASKHRYLLARVKKEEDLHSFELKYNIHLPEGYRDFLKQLGNGGAGPYYGLEPLEHGIYGSLDYQDKHDVIDPSGDFMFTEAWNMNITDVNGEADTEKEDMYFDNKWVNGSLRICNFGCGVSINLVVKGKEYGNIWVDDRSSDYGIHPDHYFGNEERLDFLTWYELWLDKSLLEIQTKTMTMNTPISSPISTVGNPPEKKRSWWKRIFER